MDFHLHSLSIKSLIKIYKIKLALNSILYNKKISYINTGVLKSL